MNAKSWILPFLVSMFLALPSTDVFAEQMGWFDEFGEAEDEFTAEPPEAPGDFQERTPAAPRSRVALSLEGLFALALSGNAGSGRAAPAYADAFGIGGGGNVKLGITLSPALALRFDGGGFVLPATRFDALGTENLFSDLRAGHLLAGLDLHIPFASKPSRWFRAGPPHGFTGAAARLSARGGVQYVDGVEWLEPDPTWSFWEPTVRGIAAFGAGLEYRSTSTFGFTLGLDVFYSGPSTSADRSGARAEAGGMLALCATVGGTIRF
ncbi:MAG: hypothetical protein ACYS47_20880 [Planctomycetota bacterium]|jgi:hypothetical protein